jgi:hypothetical protein
MTLGVSAANVANKWLDVFGNTAFSGITTVYAGLAKGDPGAAGTSNASAETERKAITWSGAASGGSKSMSGTLSWASWDAGAETISHITLWSAASGGDFLWSGVLSAQKAVSNGDTLNITALTIAIATASIAAGA